MHTAQPSLLMSRPDYFEVTYKINPWMQPNSWKLDPEHLAAQAQTSWEKLYETFLSSGITIHLAEPQPGLPDMVFTANAGIVLNRQVLLSQFRWRERQGESAYFAKTFEKLKESGTVEQIAPFPPNIIQEGAGDCVWDSHRQMFWAGYGPRSDERAIPYIEEYFGRRTIALELASERFYHMDLCLAPLTGGQIIYYPSAFTKPSLAKFLDLVPKDQLLAIDHEEAAMFACNLVNIEEKIFMAPGCEKLMNRLRELGYSIIPIPVESFAMAGGSVFCMTLRLDRQSSS